ncbi:MAG: hopanoid biosynthesis associated protein HpnK [Actinobacteria bacterium HGW-Actinobacteria-7]|jgi:predicted glycoside hydrolase/deacetylase ChbG (UPF0249 family)|nr:MAG: hopanoid biosynthesis associated protein HpnK [Actinobacteria bacterium HGW-Actinobacteria-7]
MAADRELVVNADDFGWSHSVNEGIVECHQTGIVTRTSILATGWAFEHAVELAKATPTLGIGMHLNIYRGNTILPAEKIPTLVGPDGKLLGSWQEIVGRLVRGRFDLAQVEAELRAQIQHVLAAGLTPAHLDSEKHLHLWPSMFDVVCKLAVEFGIPEVRTVREPLGAKPIPLMLGVFSARNAGVAHRHGISTSDSTVGVTYPPIDDAALERILRSARGSRVEFVVHPGHVDAEFMELQSHVANRLVCSREEELAVLASPDSREAVNRAGFRLGRVSQV